MTRIVFEVADGEDVASTVFGKLNAGDYLIVDGEEASLSDRVDALDEKLTSVRNMVFAINSRTKRPK